MKNRMDRGPMVSPIIGDHLMEQMKNTDATIFRGEDLDVAGKCNESEDLVNHRGMIEGQQLGLT
jgi:hypothetical protein